MINKTDIFLGSPHICDNGISLKVPTVKDVRFLNERHYFSFMNLFLASPIDEIVELYDQGINYEDMSDFDLFIKKVKENTIYYSFMFEHFMEISNVRYTNSMIYGLKDSDMIIFDEVFYNECRDFYRICHVVGEKEHPTFKGEGTRYMYVELQRQKNEDLEGNEIDFYKLIVNTLVGMQGAVKREELDSLSILEIYEYLPTIQKREEFHGIIQGIYNGTVDPKKINFNKVHWMK